MIDFNQIYQMATDVINYLVTSRGYIEPNTTVCVILARSGRVFNGVSHNEVHAEVEAVRNMQGFNETAVESLILVDATSRLAILPCQNCIRYISSLNPANAGALVNMPNRPVPFRELLAPSQPIQQAQPLPQGQMLTQGQPIPQGQPVQQAQPVANSIHAVPNPHNVQSQHTAPSQPFAHPVPVSATRSSMVMTGRSNASLLSGKVSGLLAATQNEDQTDEDLELLEELTESTKKKGLLGGLFGKK